MRSTWKAAIVVLAAGLPAGLQAGWPFTADGPRRGTPEWYELHSCDPIGQRQTFKFGKVWPAAPRPIGAPAPVVHRFHHNLYWPHPYTELDKQSIEELKAIQISRGWEQATTLYQYHFNAEDQSLNSSGRDHLYWIMANVPPEFRVAYVQTSPTDPEISNARLAAVQTTAESFVGGQNALPVVLRVATAPSTPAAEVDAVFQYRLKNLSPAPVLSSGGGGGGGGGGDSGGN